MSPLEVLLTYLVVLVALLVSSLFLLIFLFFFRFRRGYNDILDFFKRFQSYERAYGPYPQQLYDTPLNEIIERAERRHDVSLSWAARQMIVIPVFEQIEERGVSWPEVDSSINKIMATMREDSSESSRSFGGRRNAVAVIKAFFKDFCNIPPFCSPTGESSRRSG